MAGSPRRLGADPDQLRQVAATFERAGRALADAVGRVDRAATRTGWHGPAAARFARRWEADRALLRAVAARTAAAAAELRRHADHQTAASGRGRAAVAVPALSRSESFLRVGGFVDAGALEGRAAVVARVEELDGARSRVTVSDLVGLAGVAAVGATVEAGCGTSTATPVRPLRAEAEVSAGAEVEHRTVWDVPDDDVHRLLAAEGAERLAGALGLGPLTGLVVAPFEPQPAGQELLVRTTVSASAVSPRLGAVGPGAAAQAAAAVAVGLATGADGRSTVVLEAGNEAAATLRAGFLSALGASSPRLGGASWVRVDLPAGPSGDGQPVRLELRNSSVDGDVDRVVVHARLSNDAGARAAAAQLRRDLSAGRPPSRTAVDTLVGGLRGSLVDPVVQTDHLEARTVGCSGRSVGGAGVTLGGGGGAQVVNLRRRR